MNEPSNKTPLISKGWIQAVALVMLFGFFTMGLLAYYTYTDEPPIPAQVVDANGKVLFTGKDIIAGQQIFLKNGLMEYGSIFGHGAWLGPDYTADYLHRAAELTTDLLRRFRFGHGAAANHHRFQNQPLRRGDGRADLQRGAGGRLRKIDRLLRGLFRNAHDEIRPAPQCHHRSGTNPATHRLFQLVGLGGVHFAPGQKLFLHEQLAAGIARRQSRLGGHDVLERDLADRAARRHRPVAGRVWPLEFSRLARARGEEHFVPAAG